MFDGGAHLRKTGEPVHVHEIDFSSGEPTAVIATRSTACLAQILRVPLDSIMVTDPGAMPRKIIELQEE